MHDTVTRPRASTSAHLGRPTARALLRFAVCGSLDDGKSTLIGRLLYDSRLLYQDQLAALAEDSARLGSTGEELHMALLLDGLQAERKQITIDVAYRFFGTARRKFILVDTPGHEQYTRNMATGASVADLAVLLVDARKGLRTQTRHHSHITSLLGIRNVVLAVNKMDAVGWDPAVFETIANEYAVLAKQLGLWRVVAIPVSALAGDNVTRPSANMPWYKGPYLLEYLETVEVASEQRGLPFRMPVQWVNRPNQDFRGYCGTIVSGGIRPGDSVIVLPSARTTRVSRIVTYDGDLDEAGAGQAVTLTFEDELDAGRGDVFAAADKQPILAQQFAAHLIWMSEDRMLPGRSYLLAARGNMANAQVTDLKYKINVNTFEHVAAKHLDLNEIGFCNVGLDWPIAFDPYADNREMGNFILVDRFTNATVAGGMIKHALRRATNISWHPTRVDKAARVALKGHRPCVLWFTGLSGAGKSTIANLVEQALNQQGRHTVILDGDNFRHGLNRDLGFTDEDRVENIRRVAEVSRLMVEAGLIVLVSCISPFRNERQMARELFTPGEFFEIYIDTPLEICEARDPKGLYKLARMGKLPNLTGIGSAYEPPEEPELVLSAGTKSAEVLADEVLAVLRGNSIV